MRHHTFRITFGFILVCIIVLVASGIFFLKNNPYVSGKFFGMYARRIQVELQYALHSKDKNAETTEKQLASSVAVLAYHGIGTKTADSVSSKKIRKELIDLKIAGYETISLDQYEQFIRGEITLPEKSFLLTFDEGIKSNYFAADPILKALNYQAVLFANPSLATDLDPYYLSEWELSHLSKTNRWSLQLYNDGLDFAALNEAKSLLVDKYGSSVTAMSYSNNALSDAASLEIVPFVFNQQWPKNNFGARTNYPSVAGVQFNQHSYESVRLPVALLPTDDVRMLLNATLSSPLPYFEKLDNPFKWVASVGDSLIENNTLMFSSEGNIATAYFDGSFGFTDYQYQMTLGSDVPESHSVSLISGYKNAENYISCQFANGSASIKMVANNKETTVLNSLVLDKQLIGLNKNSSIGLKMANGNIQCFIDQRPVIQALLPVEYSKGAIAFKIWNQVGGPATFSITTVSINSLKNAEISCMPQEVKVILSDGQLCRNVSAPSNWLTIYDTYSKLTDKAVIYSSIEDGDIAAANDILKNKYAISRFAPVEIITPTWKENFNNDLYWRFNFYNLEPVRNLMYAWKKTGDPAYGEKIIELTTSYIDTGMDGPYSWDYHGTAFRTMTLIDVWWELRENNALSAELSTKILQALKTHGDFLADPRHFESDYNHGLDQSAALYLLAVNFPDIPGATNWKTTSVQRISLVANVIVDKDGVLVENSPYYHFYSLEKFWEIYKYTQAHNLKINTDLGPLTKKMISYGTYVLQPDLTIPTIGASLERKVNLSGIYKEMANENPEFMYVLTKGKSGKKPSNLNKSYSSGGQTIMRSSWDSSTYGEAAQVFFDAGEYRTNHSDLDALSFHLYAQGIPLLPDSGLYSYDGVNRNYFHGTRSHNTIVVDGKDQKEKNSGSSIAGVTAYPMKQGAGYAMQVAEENLNTGVNHKRALVLIENNVLIVVDKLYSDTEHTYEQMFHLFPGATITKNGTTLKASSQNKDQALTISQLSNEGITLSTSISSSNPIDGICSTDYKMSEPCYSASYKQFGKDASFISSIDIGKTTSTVTLSQDKKTITVKTGSRTYTVNISEISTQAKKITVDKKFEATGYALNGTVIDSLVDPATWQISGSGNYTIGQADQSLRVVSGSDNQITEVKHEGKWNLVNQNIAFDMKANLITDLSRIEAVVVDSSGHRGTFNIKSDIYTPSNNDTWISVGLAKGAMRTIDLGNWNFPNGAIDWSSITSVGFRIQSKLGTTGTVQFRKLVTVPAQLEARAVIFFDDGWSSISNIVSIMRESNMQGNIGVISGNVGKRGYLTLPELKKYQDEYGWNMVNHSSLHKDALVDYFKNNNLAGMEADIVTGAEYLVKNGLNSAPNWYVYPDGATNNEIKEMVNKYYVFARGTIDAPEFYPYADPMNIKILSVYSGKIDTEGVKKAISDAVVYNQTLFLMFHKFTEGAPTVQTEISVAEFKSIIDELKMKGLKTLTVSQLDQERGIPSSLFIIDDEIPSRLDVQVTRK